MPDASHDNLATVLEAGKELGAQKLHNAPDGVPFMVLPLDCNLVSLEHLGLRPRYKRGNPLFTQIAGFLEYVGEQKDERSRIFADRKNLTMTTVLDLHGPGHDDRAWGLNRASFAPPKDPDFTEWMAADKKPMGQEEFAQFLEDHLPQIKAPDGAALMEMCQDLEANSTVAFKSSVRLQDGSRQFVFKDEQASAGLILPDLFELIMPIFEGGNSWQVFAKLRYRIDKASGSLFLFYRLVRIHEVVDKAFADLCSLVEKDLAIKPWHGKPGEFNAVPAQLVRDCGNV